MCTRPETRALQEAFDARRGVDGDRLVEADDEALAVVGTAEAARVEIDDAVFPAVHSAKIVHHALGAKVGVLDDGVGGQAVAEGDALDAVDLHDVAAVEDKAVDGIAGAQLNRCNVEGKAPVALVNTDGVVGRDEQAVAKLNKMGLLVVAKGLDDAENSGRAAAGKLDARAASHIRHAANLTVGAEHKAVAVEARVGVVVVDAHAAHRGRGRAAAIANVAATRGARGRQRAEDVIHGVADGVEELAAVVLHAGVLEIVAVLQRVRALEGEQKVTAPALGIVGARNGLGNLATDISKQALDRLELRVGEALEERHKARNALLGIVQVVNNGLVGGALEVVDGNRAAKVREHVVGHQRTRAAVGQGSSHRLGLAGAIGKVAQRAREQGLVIVAAVARRGRDAKDDVAGLAVLEAANADRDGVLCGRGSGSGLHGKVVDDRARNGGTLEWRDGQGKVAGSRDDKVGDGVHEDGADKARVGDEGKGALALHGELVKEGRVDLVAKAKRIEGKREVGMALLVAAQHGEVAAGRLDVGLAVGEEKDGRCAARARLRVEHVKRLDKAIPDVCGATRAQALEGRLGGHAALVRHRDERRGDMRLGAKGDQAKAVAGGERLDDGADGMLDNVEERETVRLDRALSVAKGGLLVHRA
eukprot:m.32636 g.32636  ORF g.32636 m.32636 type:complete len:647 (-) comp5558_c0_seq2:517-2457(-)